MAVKCIDNLVDPALKCTYSKIRYLVANYASSSECLYDMIIKFNKDTGEGIIVLDGYNHNNESQKVYVDIHAQDIDEMPNVFKVYSKALNYRIDENDMPCPIVGEFEAYKIGAKGILDKPVLIKLSIPVNAERIAPWYSRKCRASWAKVLSIEALDGSKSYKKCRSAYDRKFKYVVGKTVRADSFDVDRRIECTHGIHFFMTEREARHYESSGAFYGIV